jgi:hypothetical protein
VAEARRLADLPFGRYPLDWQTDLILPPMPHLDEARVVISVLEYDALLRAQDRDAAGALHTNRAIFNVSRSIGDEPTLISGLVRIALHARAIVSLQRTLAQGEPPPDDLARFQALLDTNAAEPVLTNAMRGERALLDRALRAARDGTGPSIRDHVKRLGFLRPAWSTGWKWADDRLEGFRFQLPLERLPDEHAAVLTFLTEVIAISKRPVHEHGVLIAALQTTLPQRPFLTNAFAPGVAKVFDAHRKVHAQTLTAVAALAAERFRHAHGRWPRSLNELTPAFLREVPLDPYTGRPLLFKPLPDGVVIYSVYRDLNDDGGSTLSGPTASGGYFVAPDVGFRLWDVPQRRRPPLPDLKAPGP